MKKELAFTHAFHNFLKIFSDIKHSEHYCNVHNLPVYGKFHQQLICDWSISIR